MALTIHSSNRVEILQTKLSQQLAAAPLRDPFAAEIIVVPTFAIARWLNLRFAAQQGVAANFRYPLASEWIWQLAAALLGDIPRQDPYAGSALAWQIFELLPRRLEDPAFALIGDYLRDDDSGIKRWQLAQRIADSFDRYQAYRPRLIRDWSEGGEQHWQARLWRALLEERALPHRAETIARLRARLEAPDEVKSLPPRASLFALSSLAPLYLDALDALAQRIELNLYLHSPTDQYWADLENEKRRARRRLESPAQESYFETGNELLASWGRQGQVFQDRLLDRAGPQTVDIELFVEPGGDSLLERVQRSLFTLAADTQSAVADDSISIHVCHSPMRECQVLLDQILAMLERDPELHPEQILVMIPDIAGYAPYVEAVFQRARFAFNLSDTALADEHPLVTALLQLLELPSSRFTSSEVLSLLDQDAIRRRFDIDDDELAEIHALVGRGHARWGLDAEHKREFELPATDGNTWQQLRERFFCGYALAGDDLWQGIAPLAGADDSIAPALGRFWHFLARLGSWRERLRHARSAARWRDTLLQLLDEFFYDGDAREPRLQQIRDALADFEAGPDTEIPHALMSSIVAELLARAEPAGQLYSGGVTFCGMRPMRSIPFKVICLLGMNRADFPRRDAHSDFELLSANCSPGDPSKRVEDRYLLLETLLCARQKLYLSYTGRSLGDNSELQPSVLLQEFVDYLDAHFVTRDGARGIAAELTRQHPMQTFAAGNFIAPRFSYQHYWCEISARLQQRAAPRARPWPRQALAASFGSDIDLEQLRRCLENPVKYFFRQRLGIYLEDEAPPGDDEIFDLSGLEKWRLKQQLASDLLEQREQTIERLRAEGLLAHGHAAEAQLAAIEEAQAGWLESLGEYRGIGAERVVLEIGLDDGARLGGTVNGYYPGRGLMAYHGGSFKGKQLLALWIDHLALCASGRARPEDSSLLLASDQTWRISPLAPAEALDQLADYVRIYRESLALPLPVLPDGSYTRASEPDAHKARARVLGKWLNSRAGAYGGDPADSYLALVLRTGVELPLDDARYADYAQRLYARLLGAGEKVA